MRQLSEALFQSADAAEGMTAFRERRTPSWAPSQQPNEQKGVG